LENSAYTTAPDRAITGELWWDTGNNILKVYTGSAWKNVGSTTAQSSKPSLAGSNVGDLWWETTNGQLWAYDGTLLDYKLIGPIGGAAGVSAETIKDSSDNDVDILSFTIGSNRYAILSNTPTFTPKNSISGFQTIKPGLNIASQTYLSNSRFNGQASDSVLLSGLSANSFMRTDNATTTTGTLTVNNNSGLYVGTSNNLRLSVSSPNVAVTNQTSLGAMNFRVTSGAGVINAMDIYPNGNVVANFDFLVAGNISFTNASNDLVVTGTSASTNYATGALRLTAGGLGVFGNINSGGSQNRFVGNVTAQNLNSNAVVSGTTFVGTNFYGTVQTPTQPSITSLGTLTGLTVAGTVGATNYTGLISTNAQPYINSLGTLSALTVSGTSTLGGNTNVKITGGSTGQFLQTDGAGNLIWASAVTTITNTANTVALFGTTGALTANSKLQFNTVTGNLYVGGAINATGDITGFFSSDIKLKENLQPITNALNKVTTINGVTFNWNEIARSQLDKGDARESGVIAQEIQAVLPEVVTERENGYLAVNYEKIVPLLIEAIKELRAEVDVLKSKVQ
jgi:hypothetical protein